MRFVDLSNQHKPSRTQNMFQMYNRNLRDLTCIYMQSSLNLRLVLEIESCLVWHPGFATLANSLTRVEGKLKDLLKCSNIRSDLNFQLLVGRHNLISNLESTLLFPMQIAPWLWRVTHIYSKRRQVAISTPHSMDLCSNHRQVVTLHRSIWAR